MSTIVITLIMKCLIGLCSDLIFGRGSPIKVVILWRCILLIVHFLVCTNKWNYSKRFYYKCKRYCPHTVLPPIHYEDYICFTAISCTTLHWLTQVTCTHPLSVQFISLSCSFRQNSSQIIGFGAKSGVGAPVWEILDPPLHWVVLLQDITFQLTSILPPAKEITGR